MIDVLLRIQIGNLAILRRRLSLRLAREYKYQSTAAIGKTTFSKLSESWRSAQHPTKKAKQVGNGEE